MAESKELDLDAKERPSGGKKKLLLAILGAILLIGGSIGGTLLVVGGGGGAMQEAVKAPARPVPHYLALETMVVNFGGNSPARYLQVDMEVMAHEQTPLSAIEAHMPVIRNNILMLLSSQSYDVVTTREGKEALRAAVVADINKVLAERVQVAEGQGVQAVYFTSFVMQ